MIKGKTSFGICVGIATRNAEKCLPFCLRSLKAQTVKPDEYVICIGLSNDRTEEIINEFVEHSSVPTKIIHDRDGIGTGYARRAIIEHSTQEYVIWVDSDFVLPPNWIATMSEVIQRDEIDHLDYSTIENHVTLDEAMNMQQTGKLPDPVDISQLKQMNRPLNGIKVIRRSAAIEMDNYDPYFVRGQDMDLYIRLDNNGYKSVAYMGMNVYHIWEGISLKKTIPRAVYFKYLYKYGLKYPLLSTKQVEHTAAFLLRSCVAISLPLFGTCLIMKISVIVPLLMFITGFVGLVGGLIFVHSKDSFSLLHCANQIGKCFGEYYTLYQILTTRDKPKRGYGKKYISSVSDKTRKGEVSK